MNKSTRKIALIIAVSLSALFLVLLLARMTYNQSLRVAELTGIEEGTDNNSEPDLQVLGDSTRVFLTKKHLAKLDKENIPYHRYIFPEEGNDETRAAYNKDWSADFFGPYTVPADHYFVMGDNRHQSQDSRYIGPIPSSQWTGTVLNR